MKAYWGYPPPLLATAFTMTSLHLMLMLLLLLMKSSEGKVSLYLSSDQTEQLYGIRTDGLYYVRDGMVNQYAMTFQHQA